jgi:hypothetical protein
MTLTVEIQFSQLRDENRVRINEGPLGQAEGQFAEPFTVHQAASQLQQAGASSDSESILVAMGRELFAALDQAGVGEAVRVAANQARLSQDRLLLQLRFDEGAVALATLPWELLHDGRRYLLAAGAVDLTRYITYSESSVPIDVQAPLRVLFIGSAPKDLPKLDSAASLAAIQGAAGLAVEVLSPPTYDALLQRIVDTPRPHVLHFDGHGMVEGNHSCVCFEQANGNADLIDVNVLQNALYTRVALVVLNACATAALDASMGSLFQAMAPALIQAGIPAVVGMQFPLTDRSAVRFVHAFYQAIARGEKLTVAMAYARRWLYREGSWYIPTLYLRTGDPEGVLLPSSAAPGGAATSRVSSAAAEEAAGRQHAGEAPNKEIAALQELQALHRNNLHLLRRQAAIYAAGATPLHLINQISFEEQAIAEIDRRLAQTD